jgi:endo-1,4-beta-xylanase
MYWDEWPVRHPSLLFAGLKFGEADYLSTWESLKADPTTFEVLRNLPLRHPLLWVDSQAAVFTDSRTLTQLATEVRPGFLLGTHFGPIFAADTPENEKPRSIISSQYNLISVGIYPRHTTQRESRDGWDFTTVDQTVQFAEENGLRVYAHPMFGSDNYLPDWLLKGDYSNDELLEIIEERIKVILTRYKGRIHILDVYNEGLDRGESGEWREGDNFFLKLGWNENEYGRWPIALEKMLVWCRKHGGEELKLVYNDNRNTLHGAPQSLACIKMVKALKHAGIPIDGIGIQCHTRIMEDGVHYTNGHLRAGNTPFDADSFARNIRAMGEAGVDVHISECDVHLYGPVDARKLALQAEAFRNMLKACIQEPACKSFKTWGFTDASCWKAMKKTSGWGYDYEPYPLVYDHDYQPKPAYHAMRELLLTLSRNKNKATPR